MTQTDPADAAAALRPLSQTDFHDRLEHSTGVGVLMFTGAGCGHCRHWRGVLREVRTLQPDWTLFEIDAHDNAALASEYEVFHLPSLFLFRDGQYHAALACEARPAAFIATVQECLRRPAQEAP